MGGCECVCVCECDLAQGQGRGSHRWGKSKQKLNASNERAAGWPAPRIGGLLVQIDVGSGALQSVGRRRVRERRVCVLRECHEARIANCRERKSGHLWLLRTSIQLTTNPIRCAPLALVGCVLQGHAGIMFAVCCEQARALVLGPCSVPASTSSLSQNMPLPTEPTTQGLGLTARGSPAIFLPAKLGCGRLFLFVLGRIIFYGYKIYMGPIFTMPIDGPS